MRAIGTNPGATEYCNGYDDNCDGTIDEESADAPTWYLDSDSDDYLTASPTSTSKCDRPTATTGMPTARFTARASSR